MHILAFVLTLLGAVLLYLSHRNQIILHHVLSQFWRWLGCGLMVISLLLFYHTLPSAVAVFSWCITLLFIWTFIPFIGLLQGDMHHED